MYHFTHFLLLYSLRLLPIYQSIYQSFFRIFMAMLFSMMMMPLFYNFFTYRFFLLVRSAVIVIVAAVLLSLNLQRSGGVKSFEQPQLLSGIRNSFMILNLRKHIYIYKFSPGALLR